MVSNIIYFYAFGNSCSCTSSQDLRKVVNHHQPLELCLMGLEFLVLHHDHQDKFLHHLLRHLLLLLLECPLGCLRPLHHRLEMALHVQ
jgi:hypothetical protein